MYRKIYSHANSIRVLMMMMMVGGNEQKLLMGLNLSLMPPPP